MTVKWAHFIDVLGKKENSVEVINLCQAIGESPVISADAGEGKVDMLPGWINGWSKYDYGNHSVHLQYTEHNHLCHETLIKN